MLNDHEQQQLARIEEWFETEDPRLAKGFRDPTILPAEPEESVPAEPDGSTPAEPNRGTMADNHVGIMADPEQSAVARLAGGYLLGLIVTFVGAAAMSFGIIFVGIVVLVATGTSHVNRNSDRKRDRDADEPT